MYFRTIFSVLIAVAIGCDASYYRQNLASHLPREDGSMLDVECVSHIKHTVSSVSPALQPKPQVTVIMDQRTFVVHADQILLNDKPYASLASDVKKVRIEITEDGFEVTADGKPVTSMIEPSQTR
jgi:hypothetical protein